MYVNCARAVGCIVFRGRGKMRDALAKHFGILNFRRRAGKGQIGLAFEMVRPAPSESSFMQIELHA